MLENKYSDSVNEMNGCLLGCLDIFGDACLILLVVLVGPYIGLLSLCWWVVAWILGLIFPGKEFFPIKKMWARASAWFKRHTGKDIEGVVFLSAIVILLSAGISWIIGLFTGRK